MAMPKRSLTLEDISEEVWNLHRAWCLGMSGYLLLGVPTTPKYPLPNIDITYEFIQNFAHKAYLIQLGTVSLMVGNQFESVMESDAFMNLLYQSNAEKAKKFLLEQYHGIESIKIQEINGKDVYSIIEGQPAKEGQDLYIALYASITGLSPDKVISLSKFCVGNAILGFSDAFLNEMPFPVRKLVGLEGEVDEGHRTDFRVAIISFYSAFEPQVDKDNIQGWEALINAYWTHWFQAWEHLLREYGNFFDDITLNISIPRENID